MGRNSTAEHRFWTKVNKTDACWMWTGPNDGRYGQIALREQGRLRYIMAHRFSWQLHFGPIPTGLNVCHACDTPLCVNPSHLWLGTQRANMVDAVVKGRVAFGDRSPMKRPEVAIKVHSKTRGRHHSLEARAKISQAKKGKKLSRPVWNKGLKGWTNSGSFKNGHKSFGS